MTWSIFIGARCCGARRRPPAARCSAARSPGSPRGPRRTPARPPVERPPLGPIPDLRDGVVRLWLPAGFQYRSFHDTELPVDARRRHRAARPPRRHGRLPRAATATSCWSATTRSTAPAPAFGDAATPYDPMARGGTTTVEVTRYGEVRARVHQPQRHPDELLRRPDAVGQLDHLRGDGQRPGRRARLHRRVRTSPLTKRHGFIFEVPDATASPTASRSPRPAGSPTSRWPSTRTRARST